MNNLFIKTRLILLVAISLVALAAVGVAGIYGMNKGSEGVKELGYNRLPSVVGLTQMARGQTEIRVLNRSALLLENTPHAQKKFADILEKKKASYALGAKGWKLYEPLPQVPEEVEPWKQVEKEWPEWMKGNEAVDVILSELSTTNVTPERQRELVQKYAAQLEENTKHSAPCQEALDTLVDINQHIGDEYYKSAEATMSRATTLIYGLVAAALLVVAGFAAYLVRSIMLPLDGMRMTILAIESSSDFTRRVEVSSNDEIGQTVEAFNRLLAKVQGSLKDILGSVNEVSSSAQTLSSAAQQVAVGSSQQSESAASMAAAVEEMTVSITHVSDNAREALSLSDKSGELSSEGGRIIGNAVNEINAAAEMVDHTSGAITALGEQSNQISAIVQVIKEVAEQTNLLALNAAIEAARAGEEGRGFAVVADEVRKLAERTTKSTGEIAAMIDKIQGSTRDAVASMNKVVEKVAFGRELVADAGGRIDQIQQSAAQVATAVKEISGALREQSTASQSIADRVESVAQMTDENSAASNQTANSAQHLEGLALRMRENVNQFKV